MAGKELKILMVNQLSVHSAMYTSLNAVAYKAEKEGGGKTG